MNADVGTTDRSPLMRLDLRAPNNVSVIATPRLAVILPLWNEVHVVQHSLEAVITFSRAHPEYHFAFVDDGSTDGTNALLHTYLAAREHPNISLMSHVTHRGKGSAIKLAAVSREAECICFIDGDLAYSLEHLFMLDAALKSADIAIGCRIREPLSADTSHLFRRTLSWYFNKLVRALLNMPYADTQAGLKGFRTPVARHLFGLQRINGLGFDAELLFLARKFGYTVAEIPAHVSSTHTYKTSTTKLITHSTRMLIDVLKVLWNDITTRYH